LCSHIRFKRGWWKNLTQFRLIVFPDRFPRRLIVFPGDWIVDGWMLAAKSGVVAELDPDMLGRPVRTEVSFNGRSVDRSLLPEEVIYAAELAQAPAPCCRNRRLAACGRSPKCSKNGM
jgi:hypothetical protein